MTAVLLAEVHRLAGGEGVAELLARAQSKRSPDYLTDITNWVSYDEANALWEAATQLTRRPYFSRCVGEQAARRLSSSPVAALLRSLGSPEALYRQMSVTATKFSTVSRLEAAQTGPGYAEITAVAVEGFRRSAYHCEWTQGLLSCATELYGLEPALVEHEECAALGAPLCRYRVTWDADGERRHDGSSVQLDALKQQLEGMRERLRSMFATASDLIATDEVEDVLARITDRAAMEVRAPRYMLVVRTEVEGELHCHHRGFAEQEASEYAEILLSGHPADFPEAWLVVDVASDRHGYGRLMAAFESGASFFPEERELFEVYARYAASALDGAAALLEAKRRYDESSALLKLARALASAGTSEEVARRLADAVPLVVDCDRVSVYLWDAGRGQLARTAIATRDPDDPVREEEWRGAPSPGSAIDRLLDSPSQDPIFIDPENGDPNLRGELQRTGAVAAIVVPIATQDLLLGLLAVSVTQGPHRIKPNPDLLNRLSGVAAQATTALQNGRLVDQITHQATHDQLTGLANRLRFNDELRKAVAEAREQSRLVGVLYLDLDGFKPVNDRLGHDVGDRLLTAVGKRLASCTRASDVVARLGGDEFAVLIPAASDIANIDLVSTRIADTFREPFVIDGQQLRVRGSIGRAVFPSDAAGAEELLRHADESMFNAKHARLRSVPQAAAEDRARAS